MDKLQAGSRKPQAASCKPEATGAEGVRATVEAILAEIRPFLESHQGNARLVEVDADNNITLELEGTCKGCPMSVMTFGIGVEKQIRERCPEVNQVFYM